jgi:hypothetical protein
MEAAVHSLPKEGSGHRRAEAQVPDAGWPGRSEHQLGPDKIDYPVMALDGLWRTESAHFDMSDKARWKWTLMIAQPDVITAAMVREAKKKVKEKKGSARVDDIRLESWREGKVVQMLHIGPYSEEPVTIAKMHQFAAGNGYRITGKHHEIYLSDPRRTKPEKLRTLLRQPVEKAAASSK